MKQKSLISAQECTSYDASDRFIHFSRESIGKWLRERERPGTLTLWSPVQFSLFTQMTNDPMKI
jgi:hypothetical protein